MLTRTPESSPLTVWLFAGFGMMVTFSYVSFTSGPTILGQPVCSATLLTMCAQLSSARREA
jgi:hypothetical protein